MTSSVIEKPLGFELRDKRSDKTRKSDDWTAQDALFDASQAIKGGEVEDVVILWREKGSNDVLFRQAGNPDINAISCIKWLNRL